MRISKWESIFHQNESTNYSLVSKLCCTTKCYLDTSSNSEGVCMFFIRTYTNHQKLNNIYNQCRYTVKKL